MHTIRTCYVLVRAVPEPTPLTCVCVAQVEVFEKDPCDNLALQLDAFLRDRKLVDPKRVRDLMTVRVCRDSGPPPALASLLANVGLRHMHRHRHARLTHRHSTPTRDTRDTDTQTAYTHRRTTHTGAQHTDPRSGKTCQPVLGGMSRGAEDAASR